MGKGGNPGRKSFSTYPFFSRLNVHCKSAAMQTPLFARDFFLEDGLSEVERNSTTWATLPL
jgi:hypothetical protein